MRKKEGHLAPRPHRSNIGEEATRCRQVEHRALPSVMMRRCKMALPGADGSMHLPPGGLN